MAVTTYSRSYYTTRLVLVVMAGGSVMAAINDGGWPSPLSSCTHSLVLDGEVKIMHKRKSLYQI